MPPKGMFDGCQEMLQPLSGGLTKLDCTKVGTVGPVIPLLSSRSSTLRFIRLVDELKVALSVVVASESDFCIIFSSTSGLELQILTHSVPISHQLTCHDSITVNIHKLQAA